MIVRIARVKVGNRQAPLCQITNPAPERRGLCVYSLKIRRVFVTRHLIIICSSRVLAAASLERLQMLRIPNIDRTHLENDTDPNRYRVVDYPSRIA